MRPDANKSTTGDCECCDKINVVVTRRHNTLMCSACIELEVAAEARQKSVETIERSIAIDETITLQKDIHTAATVGFIELRAAIQNNDSIPAEQKEYELVKMAVERIKVMKAAIIAHDTQGMAMKNEHHAWFTQVNEVASRLRGDYREKVKQHDLSYDPKPVKTVKSKPIKVGVDTTKTEIRRAINAAAAKYGIDSSGIRMIMQSNHGMSVEDAATQFAKLMGKL